MRQLPYGANYLDISQMPELAACIESKTLFRYMTKGKSVASTFEDLACEILGVNHALALPNCTEAIRLALLSTRPAVGEKVYVPAVTFIATVNAVLSCGLIPVLVDVDENFMLDPSCLPRDATRVIVVHLDGSTSRIPANVPYVIEDCAQAFGARLPSGEMVGCTSYAGAFSFGHNKVLCSGEGGLLVSNSPDAFERMRRYHDHGASREHGAYPTWRSDSYYGEKLVTNELVAAVQLQQLRQFTKIRCDLEAGYEILRGAIPSRFRVWERASGDLKLSVRIEFDSAEQAGRMLHEVAKRGRVAWTLSRYFLPDHPIITGRRSIYVDNFPWNLFPGNAVIAKRTASVKNRLERIVCLPISPELSEIERETEVAAFCDALLST